MLLAAYFGYTGGIPFSKSFYWESDSDESSSSGSSQGGGDIPTHTIINRERPKSWITSIIEKINPFNWGTGRTETPQILVHQLPVPTVPTDPVEREAFVSERLSRKWASIYGRLDDEEILAPESQPRFRRWNFFSKWWTTEDDTDFIRNEQLQRHGKLNELDREELRSEYQASRNTSPVHPDPELEKERNKLFSKSSTSSKPSISNEPIYKSGSYEKFIELENKPSLYSRPEANDSTDTVTQENVLSRDSIPSSSADNIPTDVTASELTPLTRPESPPISTGEDSHTYPPRPKGKERVSDYFPSSEAGPFARGFTETVDISTLRKGSILLGSHFLDKIGKGKGKDKDNFNGDWD